MESPEKLIPSPPTETENITKEAPAKKTPEAQQELEVSGEQLEQHATATETRIEEEAAEIVPEAEQRIESSARGMNISPETMQVARREMGLEDQLAEIQTEADQLANTAKSEINSIAHDEHDNKTEAKEDLYKEINRRADESQVAYLSRAGELVTSMIRNENLEGLIFDPNRAREEDLSPVTRELIAKTMEEARRESTSETNQVIYNASALESIEQSIGTHRATTEADPKDEVTFERTQRRRKLFEVQPGQGAAKRETYWNTLFFPYNTESTRAFAKELLDDKIILLLGGGRARLKEEMIQNGISPREVLNIDPFVDEAEHGADSVVSASAADERLPDILHKRDIEGADEIWAEYSVPAYLENPDEIRQLFRNIDALLAEDGFARIWPTEVKHGDNAEVNIRKTALLESLNELATSGKYEIVASKGSGRPGFTLHKVSQKKSTGSEK